MLSPQIYRRKIDKQLICNVLGYILHLVSSHYTAGRRKQSGNAWEYGGKRRKKRGTKKEREKGRTDTGMAVRTAARNERKNCNYAELGASCFCPPLMCPFVTGCGFPFSGITGWRNPLGRHTGAWFSRRILFYFDLYLCVVGRFAC